MSKTIGFKIINNEVVWECVAPECRAKCSENIPTEKYIMGHRCFQCSTEYEVDNKNNNIVVSVVEKQLTPVERVQIKIAELKSRSPEKPFVQNIEGEEGCIEIFKKAEEDLDVNVNEISNGKVVFLGHGVSAKEDLLNSPYYAKVDFYEADKKRIYYVSKLRIIFESDKITIIPWTSPLASLIFESRVGERKSFYFPGSHPSLPKIEKLILLNVKKDFNIKNKKLIKMKHVDSQRIFSTDGVRVFNYTDAVDIDLTREIDFVKKETEIEEANDAAVFSSDAKYSLKEIVTLIRKEQDDIIRAHTKGCILIKGAAGSGKTTIAMHRIVYLIDNFTELFSEQKILVCVYNVALKKYLKNLLLDLGVGNVEVASKDKWALEIVRSYVGKHEFKFVMSHKRLHERMKTRAFNIRGLQNFIEKKISMIKEELITQIVDSNLNPGRKHKIIQSINNDNSRTAKPIRELSRKICDIVDSSKDSSITRLVYDEKEDEIIKDNVRKLVLKGVSKLKDYRRILREWYSSEDFQLLAFSELNVGEKEIKDFVEAQEKTFKDEHFLLPDVPLILLIVYFINDGVSVGDNNIQYDHIVVDEAQDMPAPVLFLLSKLVNPETCSMTIAGDITQTIYPELGVESWADCGIEIAQEFELTLTHRSTYSIMMFANSVLGKNVYTVEGVTQAEKVTRFGAKPLVKTTQSFDEEMAFVRDKIKKIRDLDAKGSIAINCIGVKLRNIKDYLIEEGIDCYVASRDNFEFSKKVTITTPYQVKGLEYDYVFIVNLNGLFDSAKLMNKEYVFYMNITRAQRELFISYNGETPEILSNIPRQLYISE